MTKPALPRFYNLLPPDDRSLSEILAGLARLPKELPPKYFYDEQGSALFERICELPEYYLTRAELKLMARHVADMARFLGPDCELVEFGCGSGRKTRILLAALDPALFVPVDIAPEALRKACARLAEEFPALDICAVCADYTKSFDLPEFPGNANGRRAIYFPGSTIGNLTPDEALGLLQRMRSWVGADGAVVIGVDVKKAPKVLHAAYNDAAGVTAAFNRNLLVHLNRAYGADFQPAMYAHVAFYDALAGRIEMHLRALCEQSVQVAGRAFHFAEGEMMRTEISCKYAVDEFVALAGRAGFGATHVWQDDDRQFAVYGLDVS